MPVLDISEDQLAKLIGQLDLDALEKVKNAIVKREVYFKKLQKAPISKQDTQYVFLSKNTTSSTSNI